MLRRRMVARRDGLFLQLGEASNLFRRLSVFDSRNTDLVARIRSKTGGISHVDAQTTALLRAVLDEVCDGISR